jgi:predicted RNA-binding Zn-ribbon protein involved in translation (DUF1610 family)
MTLTADEFIRRFLIHVLPSGFHRIRHYGLIANANRQDNLICARKLLGVKAAELPLHEETTDKHQSEEQKQDASYVCPDCGAPMIIIETFPRNQQPRAPPVKRGGT